MGCSDNLIVLIYYVSDFDIQQTKTRKHVEMLFLNLGKNVKKRRVFYFREKRIIYTL